MQSGSLLSLPAGFAPHWCTQLLCTSYHS